MELSYYPGCSLQGTSREFDQSIRAVCRELEVRLHELADWTCCGASSAHVTSDQLAGLLAGRNLALAARAGKDLLVPCAMCFSRLKFAEKSGAAWLPPAPDQAPSPAVRLINLHDFFAGKEIITRLRGKVIRPLHGLKVVPYYGCLTVRPPEVVDAARPEDPVALDELLETLGAQTVRWSYKTDCCGGSFAMAKPEVVRKLSGDLMAAARRAGGECFVADCPMCQANLDTRQAEIEKERQEKFGLPVFFITELMALAMAVGEVKDWLARHLVDPRPLLQERGLL